MGMRFRFAARVAVSAVYLASCAALGVACGSSASNGAQAFGSAGTSGSDAGPDAADAEPAPTSLAFELKTTLMLQPKATRTLRVVTTPAGNFRVSFALLGSGPDSGAADAALDASEVDTDDQGVAQVTLTAPSMPATFDVRASVGSTAQDRLSVSVSARNYTTLQVLPSYSGKRPVTTWTATASGGVTCAQLIGNPPPDGILSTTAAAGQALEITNVPVGLDLAVTLRAGHYIGGCANQSALSETDGNQVLVYASDRPLNLDATQLELSFGPTEPSSALSKLMNASSSEAEIAITDGSVSDVAVLLDAMHDATATASRNAFSAARQAHTWDAALSATFGSGAATRLRDPVARWLSAGLSRFYAADTFAAQLSGQSGGALLALGSVAGVPATNAGFPTTFQGTWSADSSDTLLLGTELTWLPSRLVTALATLPASLEFPETMSVETALSQSVDCALVGATLIANGTTAGSAAYAGCDETCSEKACLAALTALWKKAANASGSASASLSVTATGAAQVGDDASVTSLNGSWVGQLQIGTDTAAASGTLTAAATTK